MRRRVRQWLSKLNRLLETEPIQVPELLICGQQDMSREPTIVVHGYLANKNGSQRQSMIEQIRIASPEHSYLLSWSSGRFYEPLLRTYDLRLLLMFRFYIWGIPAYLASRAALEFFKHYKQMEDRADRLGQALPTILAEQLPNHVQRINLCGHSLGARVVVESILHSGWQQEIDQCVLLAGALGQHRDWQKILMIISGPLNNFYSDRDKMLLLKPDREICIGRHGILAKDHRIINHATGLRHSDYWSRLPDFFRQTGLSNT